MTPLLHSLSRRSFLKTGTAALAGACLPAFAAPSTAPLAAFFVIGDTHFRANKDAPDQLDEDSAATTRGLVDTLSRLAGTAIPAEAGGGQVAVPMGVLHVGDLIDSGDKTAPINLAMQHTEWVAYFKEFGLNGTEGRLKYPVMDIIGNHDAPQGKGFMVDQLVPRQRSRQNLKALSSNGLHYSWEWGGVHFAALGLVVGTEASEPRHRRYAAMDSLAFLKEDLTTNVAKDQPLIILHHVDVARYTVEKDGTDYTKWEWDPVDVHAFHAALEGRRVATFHGHTHKRDIQCWDGHSVKAGHGIGIFNVDNSAHFSWPDQAFFYVEVHGDSLLVREYATLDRWKTGTWTPQTWSAPL